MAALLRLDNVSKSFGAVTVADSLCLEVAEGEVLGVLGPNGAGKSTMFNMVAGGLRPDSGRIYFAGRDITSLPPHQRCRLGIGRTYQIPHPFSKMTVFENLVVGAAFSGNRHERECTALCVDVLDRTGLLPKANVLSGGLTLLERKRLEMARALATSPKILLLDEIAGGLTDAECHDLVHTITEINRAGTTIVWIEHVVHALLSVATRLFVLHFGRKLDDGPPATVMANPMVQEVYLGIDET